MNKLLIVSADNHCGGRCEDYQPYLEPEYHAALERQMAEEREFLAVERGFGAASDNALSAVEIIDQRNAIRDGGALGVWDIERRLRALDDEGVAAEIVNVGHHLSLTPFFTMLSRPHPSELRSAGARAHHRWFADKMAPGKGRIFGVADPGGCEDMDAAVREVHWCADHGFVAMGCPHATEDKNLPPRQAFWQLIQGGVFDRYPQMKVVFSEVRSDWLPDTLAYLDERFEKESSLTKLKPREYFERHCYVAPSSPRPSEMQQRREIGIDRMLLGIDYPHVEGTWPNTWDWLRSIFTDFSEEEARKFAGLNAIGLFKLDEAYLTGIAERIGPEIGDIVGSNKRLDPKLLDHFHFRSGYKSPAEVVDRHLLAETVEADFAGLRRLTT
jgi:predicted TIM-barrel fold metal-dependent hydrolase